MFYLFSLQTNLPISTSLETPFLVPTLLPSVLRFSMAVSWQLVKNLFATLVVHLQFIYYCEKSGLEYL